MEKKEKIFSRKRVEITILLITIIIFIDFLLYWFYSADQFILQFLLGYQNNRIHGDIPYNFRYPDWNLYHLSMAIIILYSLSIIIPFLKYCISKHKIKTEEIKLKLRNDLIYGVSVCT